MAGLANKNAKILFLGLFFFAMDIAADVCAGLALGHSVPAVVIFSVARGLQMAAVPLSIFVLEFDVPTTLAWVHFGLACLLGLLDVVEVVLQHLKADAPPEADDTDDANPEEKDDMPKSSGMSFTPLASNGAFAVEPTRRKRFVFSVANRTKWAPKTRVARATKRSKTMADKSSAHTRTVEGRFRRSRHPDLACGTALR